MSDPSAPRVSPVPRAGVPRAGALAAALALAVALAVAVAGCELPQEPVGADATDAGLDTRTGDTAGAADGLDAGAGPPVPCTALTGTWQVTLCNSQAVAVQFAASGCTATIISPAVELHGGFAELRQPDILELTLPGGVAGALSCEARLTPAAFSGVCANAVNRCTIAGVRQF